jgi:hypothetical protein
VDSFDRRADGTVRFQFNGTGTISLGRPTLKQYRNLVESLSDLRSRASGTTAEDGSVREGEEITLLDLLLEWYAVVFTELGDGPLPDEENLPAWLLNGQIAADLVEHWQKVPSRRGGR